MQLSYSEVEAALARRHLIADGRREAFRGRLKHLQRNGFPLNVNTGKGHRAAYSPEAIVQLTVALELIQSGLAPERAAKMIVGSWSVIARGFSSAGAQQSVQIPEPLVLVFATESLRPLTQEGEEDQDFINTMTLSTAADIPAYLKAKAMRGADLITTINITSLFAGIMNMLPTDGEARQDFSDYWMRYHPQVRKV